MKLYTCTSFRGHWPIPVAVVVADDLLEATDLLSEKLSQIGLGHQTIKFEELKEIDLSRPGAHILNDGEY